MQTVRTVLSVLICVLLLGACGLKGPLYLPPDEPVSKSAKKSAADSTEEEKDEQEESNKEKSTDDQDGR